MLGGAQYHHGEIVFLLSLDGATRRGPLICATNNVNPQCCRGVHNNNTDINGGGGIGEWYYNGTLVPTLDKSGDGNLFRNRSLWQVHLNGMILSAGIYRCVVPDTTRQNVSATITLTNGETHVYIHAHTCTYMHIHAHTCTYMHICEVQAPHKHLNTHL